MNLFIHILNQIEDIKFALGLNNIAITLMIAALIVGITIGVLIVTIVIALPDETTQKKTEINITVRPRKLVSPARHRKESSTRAADRAVMMVARHAVDMPRR